VRLVSADPGHLVRHAMLDASEALQQVETLQRHAAESIQAGQLAAAMTPLGEAMTLWQSVRQTVADGAALVGLDLSTLQVEGAPAAQVVGRLTDQLRSLKNALAANDHIGLSDALLYELPEVIDEWRGLLEQMHAAAGSATTPPTPEKDPR
jgi:hypothetical protein